MTGRVREKQRGQNKPKEVEQTSSGRRTWGWVGSRREEVGAHFGQAADTAATWIPGTGAHHEPSSRLMRRHGIPSAAEVLTQLAMKWYLEKQWSAQVPKWLSGEHLPFLWVLRPGTQVSSCRGPTVNPELSLKKFCTYLQKSHLLSN